MAEQSAFCSFCGGGKPCLCGACEKNAGPESFGGLDRCTGPPKGTVTRKLVAPRWSEEDDMFLKTSLQEIRGAPLTDSTMSMPEARQLETLLVLNAHAVLFVRTAHVFFVPSRHHVVTLLWKFLQVMS